MATSNPEWEALQNLTDALCELWRRQNAIDITDEPTNETSTALQRI